MKAFLKAVVALSLIQTSFAQGPIRVSAEEAGKHLIKKVDAPYPPMARIAHIQGVVIIDLSVSETGSVSNVRAISGHPILIQAAIEAARQWRYEPFVRGGVAVPVKASVLVRFSMDEASQSPALARYYEKEGQCWLDMVPEQIPEAGNACVAASELADALPPNRLEERVKINVYAGDALSSTGKFKEASQYYQKAIEANEEYERSAGKTKWMDPAAVDAYVHSAFALHSAGDMTGADSRYTQAESILERQIKSEQNSRARDSRGLATLKHVLERHAALLRQFGRTADADKLIERANQIKTEPPEPPRK